MRLRHKAWAIPELEKDDRIFFDPVDRKGRWQEIFANDYPIHLEIGSGWGKFALTSAQANPHINYIALEREAGVLVYAARDFREAKLSNLVGVRTIAERLDEFFAEDELDRIYLNFSNPWPANRHRKRRLSHPRFLAIYEKILHTGGQLHLKTDDEGFFRQTLTYLEESPFEIIAVDEDLAFDKPGNIMTEYEEKWRKQGIPIRFVSARIVKGRKDNG